MARHAKSSSHVGPYERRLVEMFFTFGTPAQAAHPYALRARAKRIQYRGRARPPSRRVGRTSVDVPHAQ
eukprot:4814037-Prymnesium_polylepis.1